MDFGHYNKRWLALQVRPRYEFIAAMIQSSMAVEVGEDALTLVAGSNTLLAPEVSPSGVPAARLMNLPQAVVA
ncbi:MAG TPA: hypothetical protein VG759_27190 [Candidatus Angelobacter sp.]|jgi:hypothetical protein|nr:hypothetical protein [Candidatus Angelobacter sp.]